MEEPEQAPPPKPTGLQVLLGLFILGQLCFLFLANALNLLREAPGELKEASLPLAERLAPGMPKEQGHAWELVRTFSRLTDLYAQATGQLQDWALFAPNVHTECAFLAVELRWDDDRESFPWLGSTLLSLGTLDPVQTIAVEMGRSSLPASVREPEMLRSQNEPESIEAFVRVGNFRLRRFENNLALVLDVKPGETQHETELRWQERIDRHVRDEWRLLHAYLRWRLQEWKLTHPEAPQPRQVILRMRRYHLREPGLEGFWDGPFVEPVARWLPGLPLQQGWLPIQRYDPVEKRFEGVPR